MRRANFLLIAALFLWPLSLTAGHTVSLARILGSANGWRYANSEWIHPDGYKFVNNKVVRTTAKPGGKFPNPPGRLAQQHAMKLAPPAKPGLNVHSVPEKAAETRAKNLYQRPASQTGSHL